ncbi:MAG: site-specific integrase [Methanotrichaceae archaeon]|nr:site-specific integrase [Methanotrichaceae archaeon]
MKFDGLIETDKKKILDMAFGQDKLMIRMLMETELSADDLIKLKVSDVDLEKRSLKDSVGNTISLSAQALAELRNHIESKPKQAYLFEGRCGKPLTIKWKRCVLEKIFRSPAFRDKI